MTSTIGAVVARTDIDELTEVQTRCVEAAVGGRDVLAVISTGGGKSAIYQLAGAARPGPTLVEAGPKTIDLDVCRSEELVRIEL